MPVPTPKELRDPVLELVSKSEDGLTYSQLAEEVAEHFSLSEEDRRQLLPGYQRTVLVQNLYIVVTRLRKSGLLLPADGSKVIRSGGANPAIVAADDLGDMSPEQRMSLGYVEHFETLLEEVLESVRSIGPTAFERLSVDLLSKIGYGDGLTTPRSKDGGIDGILSQDPLGLEKVYVQAKRWNTAQVQEKPIRDFYTSLVAVGATKGVFITNSTFADNAKEVARNFTAQGRPLRLIDGRELAKLMIRHGVGVVTEITYEVKKLDANYFAEV